MTNTAVYGSHGVSTYGSREFGAVRIGAWTGGVFAADIGVAFRVQPVRRQGAGVDLTGESVARRLGDWARMRALRSEKIDWRAGLAEVMRSGWNLDAPMGSVSDITTSLGEIEERAALSELATELTGPPKVLLSMLRAARSWLQTPDGGWGDTQQRWSDLTDATWVPGDKVASEARTDAVVRVARKHFAADMHASRR